MEDIDAVVMGDKGGFRLHSSNLVRPTDTIVTPLSVRVEKPLEYIIVLENRIDTLNKIKISMKRGFIYMHSSVDEPSVYLNTESSSLGKVGVLIDSMTRVIQEINLSK